MQTDQPREPQTEAGRSPRHWTPCSLPGPAWGHCGNPADYEVRRADGTRGVSYWCQDHRDTFQVAPGHSIEELVFTPIARDTASDALRERDEAVRLLRELVAMWRQQSITLGPPKTAAEAQREVDLLTCAKQLEDVLRRDPAALATLRRSEGEPG